MCNFEGDDNNSDSGTQENQGGKIECPIDVGEILVSPVTASFNPKDAGAALKKTYWLVMFKTRQCYDFAGHVHSIVTCDDDIVGKMRKVIQGVSGNISSISLSIDSPIIRPLINW